jgi:hypothetical protein
LSPFSPCGPAGPGGPAINVGGELYVPA